MTYMTRALSLWILWVAFLGIPGFAEEPVHFFQIQPSTITLPEQGIRKGYAILTEKARYNFFPPADSALEVDTKARKLKLTPVDHKCTITLQITTNDVALLKEPQQTTLHDLVQRRYTNDVTQALMFYTGIGPGWSFDVEQVSTNRTRLITRVAFFPMPDGLGEATFTTPKSLYQEQRFRFSNLFGSLIVTSGTPSGGLRRPNPGRAQEISR